MTVPRKRDRMATATGWVRNTYRYSENTLRDLNYQLKQICRRNRDGSFTTQRDRERLLTQIADQLHDLGYRHMSAQSLKPKHIEASGQELARRGAVGRRDEEPAGGHSLVGAEGQSPECRCPFERPLRYPEPAVRDQRIQGQDGRCARIWTRFVMPESG